MALVWSRKGKPLGGGPISFIFCRRELGLTPNGFLSATRPDFVEQDGPDHPLAPYAGARCTVIQLDEAEAARKAEGDGARPRWKAGFYRAEIFPQTAEERVAAAEAARVRAG
jgi:hypothetical protein